jgi:hypothetical protein
MTVGAAAEVSARRQMKSLRVSRGRDGRSRGDRDNKERQKCREGCEEQKVEAPKALVPRRVRGAKSQHPRPKSCIITVRAKAGEM